MKNIWKIKIHSKKQHVIQDTKKPKAKHGGEKSASKWRVVKDREKGQDKVTEVANIQANNTQRDTLCVWLREQCSIKHKEGNKKREDTMK